MEGMGGMGDMPKPGDNPMPDMEPMVAMHSAFFWGKNVEILFSGWPGHGRLGMYLLALFFVFALSMTVEFLSATKLLKPKGSNQLLAGLVQTGVHAIRVGLSYLVMLSIMSFNLGVLLVAIVGHALGFLVFRSRAFRRPAQLPLIDASAMPK